MSLIVFIVMIVCIVFGIKRAVKRLTPRGEGYRKVDPESDILLDNLDHRDDPHHID